MNGLNMVYAVLPFIYEKQNTLAYIIYIYQYIQHLILILLKYCSNTRIRLHSLQKINNIVNINNHYIVGFTVNTLVVVLGVWYNGYNKLNKTIFWGNEKKNSSLNFNFFLTQQEIKKFCWNPFSPCWINGILSFLFKELIQSVGANF